MNGVEMKIDLNWM